MRTGLLGLAVGLALADSSIVTLALPEILRDFDVGVTTVAWVLTSFNLVLALVALPAAYVARRRPRTAFVAGTVVFAAASLLCGFAPNFEWLVAARCIQAVGAALVVTAAISLLAASTGSESRATRLWVAAGVFGAALGPAAGGVLTEVLGWESIFLAQVPLARPAAGRRARARPAAAAAARRATDARGTTPRCCCSRAGSSPRSSCSCCCSSRAGACRRRKQGSGRHGHAARGDRGRAARAALRRRCADQDHQRHRPGRSAGSPPSRCSCRVRTGPGRSRRSCWWPPESGSRSYRSPSARWSDPTPPCKAAGRSPRVTPGWCSACSCSRRS